MEYTRFLGNTPSDENLIGKTGARINGQKGQSGFIITTDAFRAFKGGRSTPIYSAIDQAVSELESTSGRQFGNQDSPLLLTLTTSPVGNALERSVPYLGMTDEVALKLAERNPEKAFAAYREMLEAYGKHCNGDSINYNKRLEVARERLTNATPDVLVVRGTLDEHVPYDPNDQFRFAVIRLFNRTSEPTALVAKVTDLDW